MASLTPYEFNHVYYVKLIDHENTEINNLPVHHDNLNNLDFTESGELNVNISSGSVSLTPQAFLETTLINNQTISAGFNSSSLDIQNYKDITILVNSDGAINFNVQYSNDNTNWFETANDILISGAGGGTYALDLRTSAKYIRVNCGSGSNVLVNCFINGK